MSTFRRLTQLAGLGLAAASAYYLTQFARRTRPLGSTRLIAHRGGPRYGPENTLAAFAHAVEVGADMLECDVQLSADGEPVIIHDETLERTTDGAGPVKDKTLAELRRLNAGGSERLPTLREFIELGKGAGVELLIELKSPHLYPGLEAKVVAALEESGYVEMSVVQSFDWDSLRRTRQLKPSLRLGALYDWGQWDLRAPAADAEYVCPPAEAVLLNPGLVRQAHAEGRGVFVWLNQVEHPLTYRWLLAFGVDGIIADDPVALRQELPLSV